MKLSGCDFDEVHEFASDPEVCRYTTWGPNSPRETREFLAEASATASPSNVYGVALDGKVIAAGSIWVISQKDRVGEFGYTIHRNFWGNGFGTEAAKMLIHIGFTELKLERISATCHPDNVGSIRVLEKCGLRYEGLLRGNFLARGERRDSLIFGVLAGDRQRRFCFSQNIQKH